MVWEWLLLLLDRQAGHPEVKRSIAPMCWTLQWTPSTEAATPG